MARRNQRVAVLVLEGAKPLDVGIPALLWGPRGGNVHMSDEYVEIDSLVASTKALLAFVCHWCGVTR